MAVLIAVIVPSFTKYIAKSKRMVDVTNAESFVRGARVVLINHTLDTRYDGVYYSHAVAWNKSSRFNRDNPQNLLDYFASELGELPLSKAYPDYFWTFEYDQEANPKKIYIGPTPGNRKYELWPDSSDYLEGK